MSEQQHNFHSLRIKEIEGQLKDNKVDLKDAAERVEKLKKNLKQHENSLAAAQKKISELQDNKKTDPKELATSIENIRQQILAEVQKRSTMSSKIEYLRQSRHSRIKVQEQQQSLLKKQQAKLNELSEKQQGARTELNKSEKNLADLNSKAQQLRANEAKITKQYEDKKNQWYAASDISHKAQAQLEALQRFTAAYGGYYQGAKNILKERSKLFGIVGSVVELLQLAPRYSKAIETVLGGQLQNIITVDDRAAKQAIEYLNKNRLGRATFLPQNKMKNRNLPTRTVEQLGNIPGVLGIASELIQMDESNQSILNYLLGTTVIVKDLAVGVNAANTLRHSARIVTLNGEVINASGSMAGGTDKQKRIGLLEQKQQHKRLHSDLKVMQEKLSQIELEGNGLAKKRKQVQVKVQEITSEISEAQKKRDSLADINRQISYQVENNQNAYKDAQDGQNEHSAQTDKIYAEIRDAKEQQSKIEGNIAELRDNLAQKQAATAVASDSEKKYSSRIATAKQEAALEGQRIDTLKIQLKEAQNQQSHLTVLIKKQTATMVELSKQSQLHATNDHDLAKKTSEVKEQMNTATKLQAKLTKQKAQVKDQVATETAKLQRVSELQEATRDEQQQEQVLLSRINTLLDRNLDDLSEKYEMSYELAKQQDIETDHSQVKHHLKLLQMGLDDLGEVNLGSIKEFERINQRYDFLTQQQTDLLTAKDQLENSMNEMDNEVKTRFKNTFEKVAASFTRVFPQIFEGGSAYLSLTDRLDLLQTGIEITAQPPGKKPQQLSLLSGGERTLTAIALLFAILQVSPVPFAILDEAEAALDDANVIRYSQYLRRLDHDTQFIIITHRKGTMVQADVLYGVTMQDSGVSRMVSVSLEDVI